MITLSDFQRRLSSNGNAAQVSMAAGRAVWLAAQTHLGHNIGDTDTHVIFVELKASTSVDAVAGEGNIGPSVGT